MIDTLRQDLKYAARSLWRTPGFAVAATVTLALGIGANAAMFTLLDAALFKPLNVPAPADLVTLYEQPREGRPDVAGGTGRYLRFSYPHFERMRDALGTRGSLAAMTRTSGFIVRIPERTRPAPVRTQLVSAGYFSTLGVAVAHGRDIDAHDMATEGVAVAVIGDRLWKEHLGGGNVLGRTLVIGGVATTIVGITPPGFIGAWSDGAADLWLPLTMQQALEYRANMSSYGPIDIDRPWFAQDRIAWLNIIGRIPAHGVAPASSALEVANRGALADMARAVDEPKLRDELLANTLVVQSLEQGFSRLRTQLADAFIALSAIVAFVLLVACANVANLLLARSTARSREMAIRIAVGASRRRLLQQGLVESTLLAALGGAAGWVVGHWSSGLLASAFLSTSRDLLPGVYSPDVRVLVFTTLVSVVTALLCGLLPAARTARNGAGTLAAASRSGVAAPSVMRGMRPLVAAQLALAVVVVFSAALLGRGLINLARLDPGYDIDHVVSVSFNPAASGYQAAQFPALGARLAAAVGATPGFVSTALSRCGLLADCSYSSSFVLDGNRDRGEINLDENHVGPGYFSTTGIPIIAGREFTDRDSDGGALVAIVSQSVANRYFAGGNPIGRRIGDDEFTADIVGVVGDVRPYRLREAPVPMVYFPIRQWASLPRNLAVRVDGDANLAVASVRAALQRAEPGLVLDSVGTMALQAERNVLRERLVTYLAALFGALALLLGCVGLYGVHGVLSYSVARRTQEFGVRLALGASPRDLTRAVLRDALSVTVAGTVVGLVIALWASGLFRTLLFQVTTVDPLVAVASAGLLLAATLLASYLPARRAARVNPISALRTE
jgi:predicted permease